MLPANRIAIAVALLVAVPLAAQGSERDDVHVLDECRLAAQVIRTGHPAPRREWAYGFITRCREIGPAALASRWQETASDEPTLQQLARATTRLRTREVFVAVSGAARSAEHSPLVRIYAMAMLYSFAEPGSSVWMRDLLQPRENRSVRIYQVSGDGDRPNPLGDVEAEVEALLAEIIAAGGEPQVIRVATEIHRLL
ncbi:MAG TPA: hypothetical protein VGC13_18730 [Longimicrobium sp.]|jgi:hypothetical protein